MRKRRKAQRRNPVEYLRDNPKKIEEIIRYAIIIGLMVVLFIAFLSIIASLTTTP